MFPEAGEGAAASSASVSSSREAGRIEIVQPALSLPATDAEQGRRPTVVVTMPAYNAERTLARTVAEIPRGAADKLILVDDASPDNTAELARSLAIEVHVHPQNRGYGGNQKTCYAAALLGGADIVVMLHPDYQYEPRAVPLLVAPILVGHADMTFGSRFSGLGNPRRGGMPLYRYVGNRATTVLENFMLGSRFTEMHSGMRAYTRECLLSLPFLRYSDGFVFDSQLLVDAITSGQRVVEVPIPTRYSEESSSIDVGRSLQYVAGSLAHCARQSLALGRQGSRSPVANPARLVSARSGGARSLLTLYPTRASQLGLFGWIARQAAGYVAPNRLISAKGLGCDLFLEAAAGCGWSEARPGEPAGVAVLLDIVVSPGRQFDQLWSVRNELDAEGLLAITATTPASHSAGLHAALLAAGFRIVEWTRLPRRAKGRPLSRLAAALRGDPFLVIARAAASQSAV